MKLMALPKGPITAVAVHRVYDTIKEAGLLKGGKDVKKAAAEAVQEAEAAAWLEAKRAEETGDGEA